MNLEWLNKKLGWPVVLAVSFAVLDAALIHALQRSRRNERSAGNRVVQLQLENSALKDSLYAERIDRAEFVKRASELLDEALKGSSK